MDRVRVFLDDVRAKGLLRVPVVSDREDMGFVKRGGVRLLSFACNDCLGLSRDEAVKSAVIDATNRYGVGAGASRAITGNHCMYDMLERKIADMYGKGGSLIFGSGYAANLGVIQSLCSRGDLIIADRLVHSSIIDGSMLSGAKLMRFLHGDLDHCVELLRKYREDYNNCVVVVEKVHGMYGDVIDSELVIDIAKRYEAISVIDYSHAIDSMYDFSPKADICVGTFSKFVGVFGGYVCASSDLIDYFFNRAHSLLYSTALPPAILASVSVAIDSARGIYHVPVDKAKKFAELIGVDEPMSHILPIFFRKVSDVMLASKILEENGYLVTPIRPPTVPVSMLRLVFSVWHTDDVINKFARVFLENVLPLCCLRSDLV